MPAKIEKHKEVEDTEYVEQNIEWSAPGRPFIKRGKQYYLTGLLIMLLVEIILFLFSEYLLMFVVVALVFVSFALSSVPPRDFKYRISSEGIQIEDGFFLWQELYDFYFYKKEGYEAVHIRTKDLLPGELVVTLGKEPEATVKSALIKYLPFREYVRPTFIDRAGLWLAKTFPLEQR